MNLTWITIKAGRQGKSRVSTSGGLPTSAGYFSGRLWLNTDCQAWGGEQDYPVVAVTSLVRWGNLLFQKGFKLSGSVSKRSGSSFHLAAFINCCVGSPQFRHMHQAEAYARRLVGFTALSLHWAWHLWELQKCKTYLLNQISTTKVLIDRLVSFPERWFAARGANFL